MIARPGGYEGRKEKYGKYELYLSVNAERRENNGRYYNDNN